MTSRSFWISATFAVLVCGLGTAAAQTPAGTVGVTAGTPPTSATDQITLVDGHMQKMTNAATRVRHLFDDARRNRDTVKVTCLSDKLAQIEVANRSAKDRYTSLKAAAARGEADVRNHEFSVLGVLRKRVEQLDSEANQCIGEEIGFPGETKITYTIDPNIATVDPNAPGGVDGVLVPPLPASGVK